MNFITNTFKHKTNKIMSIKASSISLPVRDIHKSNEFMRKLNTIWLKAIVCLCCFMLTSCSTDDDLAKSNYIDKDLNSTIDNYVNNAVDNFTEKIENESGLLGWKNFRDYSGLGNEGFKERIHQTWEYAYDNETLEIAINNDLLKKGINKKVKLQKGINYIDNFIYTLLFPFITYAFEELILWLILFLAIQFIIIPYWVKNTERKKIQYKNTGSFWTNLATYALSSFSEGYSYQQRLEQNIAKSKAKWRKIFLVIAILAFYFFIDSSATMNKSLKEGIKKDIVVDIKDQII
jgi:hypothetical protein